MEWIEKELTTFKYRGKVSLSIDFDSGISGMIQKCKQLSVGQPCHSGKHMSKQFVYWKCENQMRWRGHRNKHIYHLWIKSTKKLKYFVAMSSMLEFISTKSPPENLQIFIDPGVFRWSIAMTIDALQFKGIFRALNGQDCLSRAKWCNCLVT